MGKRGPKPLPAAVLARRRSKEPRARELKVKQLRTVIGGGSPQPPEWLTVEERGIWDHIVQTLSDMGVISAADAGALARYCHALSEWIVITAELRGKPRLMQRGEITPYLHPLFKMKGDLAKEIQSLEDRFGMTPSARVSLNVTAMFKPGYKAPEPEPLKKPSAPIGGERFFRAP